MKLFEDLAVNYKNGGNIQTNKKNRDFRNARERSLQKQCRERSRPLRFGFWIMGKNIHSRGECLLLVALFVTKI